MHKNTAKHQPVNINWQIQETVGLWARASSHLILSVKKYPWHIMWVLFGFFAHLKLFRL